MSLDCLESRSNVIFLKYFPSFLDLKLHDISCVARLGLIMLYVFFGKVHELVGFMSSEQADIRTLL